MAGPRGAGGGRRRGDPQRVHQAPDDAPPLRRGGCRAGWLPVVEDVSDGLSQELFPQLSSDVNDEGQTTLEDDVLSLEGAGLFGNLDG
jgi:hypothetical protein